MFICRTSTCLVALSRARSRPNEILLLCTCVDKWRTLRGCGLTGTTLLVSLVAKARRLLLQLVAPAAQRVADQHVEVRRPGAVVDPALRRFTASYWRRNKGDPHITQNIQTMQSHTPVFGRASGSWWQPSLACAAPRALAARASLPLHGSPAGEGRSPHARSIRSARGRMRRTWPHHDRLLESVSEIQNLLQQLDSLPDSTFLSTARGSRGSSQTATRTSLPDSWSSISTSASETSLLTGIFACGHHAHLRLPSQP